jgi:dienelactone hydrolase
MEQKISLSKSEILLTTDDSFSKEVIALFLPGISGQAFSPRFQPLVDVCGDLKLSIARMEAWKDVSDVKTKTWAYFIGALDEVLEHLLNLGYSKIITVGKSFGGGLLLSYHHKNIYKKILWAPAIGVGELDTFTKQKEVNLSDIVSLLDIQLDQNFVKEDSSEICIIHGTKDTSIPLENSRHIVAFAQRGTLVEIEDADHSFKTPEEERRLMEATRGFLLNN